MPLIGTAGHVDHGKSTLIRQITGREPDRWEEERRRGLTIDLGFAWKLLPDGTEVSFVDVPGHERYLKNMLAGIEAIDVALFVVAADEGWMPQSEEHLAVLDLLDVRRGVVALTKSDVVDEDLIELASAEIADQLAGTSLEGSAIVPVSGVTGAGIDALLDELLSLVPASPNDIGRPRMWVDRVFTVAGAGTVVTGTLLDGVLSVGDQLEVWPRGIQARIRGIQSHEQSHETIEPGRRVALNLGGPGRDELRRGDMIGLPGQWETSDRVVATMRRARYVDELPAKGAYQIHLGSSAHGLRILSLSAERAVVQLDIALPLVVGDRYILRDTGRKLVVGGGQIVDPAPRRRTKRAIEMTRSIDPNAQPNLIADQLLEIRSMESLETLRSHSGGGEPSTGERFDSIVVSVAHLEEMRARAIELVDDQHADHPLRPGLPLATLAERLDVATEVAEALVERTDQLERLGPDVARQSRQVSLSQDQSAAWAEAESRLGAGLSVPSETDLGVDRELIHLKIRSGELIRIAAGLVYLPEQVEQIKRHITELGDGFTVAEFRDASGLSRKYAVPILEWADKEGLTVRRGDTRSVR